MNEDNQIIDEDATLILMHRDAHFSGSFPLMLDYYGKEGKGVQEDFTLERIHYLATVEEQMGENLAPQLLGGSEAEKVAASKQLYKQLRDLYEDDTTPKTALLIADLILSEDPSAEKEIAAIVAEENTLVPALIDLIKSSNFHDPLFPGYGLAPIHAIYCLGQIKDERAIIPLFEQVGTHDFTYENQAIAALQNIGTPAKKFLIQTLQGEPITLDNERAAIALGSFTDDPDVSSQALKLLEQPSVRSVLPLSNYLALICTGLSTSEEKEKFQKLSNDPLTPESLIDDIKEISKQWS